MRQKKYSCVEASVLSRCKLKIKNILESMTHLFSDFIMLLSNVMKGQIYQITWSPKNKLETRCITQLYYWTDLKTLFNWKAFHLASYMFLRSVLYLSSSNERNKNWKRVNRNWKKILENRKNHGNKRAHWMKRRRG